jgi:GNAT domain-containint protein/N-acyltransferase family protein
VNAGAVRDALGLDTSFDHWLRGLQAVDAEPASTLPGDADATEFLRRMHVPDEDIPLVVAARPDAPALHWVVDRERATLVRQFGHAAYSWWPELPATTDELTFLHVWAFLATLPALVEWYGERGIPDDVAWTTLADLGRNMAINHRVYDRPGLDVPWWLTLHFTGALYELGRLQFERHDRGVGIHIAEAGPFPPDACDESIARAHEFLPRYFPDEHPTRATCTSWLLDPQLADYLPPASNIIRFQRRFTLRADKSADDNASVIKFVFRAIDPDLDALPQDTTLQRAIVEHIKSGRSWQTCSGWFEW